MFEVILIALKFSPSGLHAFDTAVKLARSLNARLHAFHALDFHLKGLDKHHPQLNEAMQNADRQIANHIQPRLTEMKWENFYFECSPADPALETCRIAKRIRADLIVVGCHQTHRRMSMGRVDYVGMTILEKAPCAVMLIPLEASTAS